MLHNSEPDEKAGVDKTDVAKATVEKTVVAKTVVAKTTAERTVSSPSTTKRVVRSTTTSITAAASAAAKTATTVKPIAAVKTATTTTSARTKLSKSKSDNPESTVESKVSTAKKIFQGKWQKHLTKPVKDGSEHTRGGSPCLRLNPSFCENRLM